MALPATDAFTGITVKTRLATWSSNWTELLGALQGANGVAAVTGGGAADAIGYWNADSFNANQYSQVVVTPGANNYYGAAVRCFSDGSGVHGYGVYGDTSDKIYLFKYNDGTYSDLANSGSGVLTSGDTLRLEASSSTLTTKKNGATTGCPGATTDSGGLGSGAAGICAYAGADTTYLDNWEGGNLSGGPTSIDPAECTQSQSSDAATVSFSIVPSISPAECTQSQPSDAAPARGLYPLSPAECNQTQTSDAATVSFSQTQLSVTPGKATLAQSSDSASVNLGKQFLFPSIDVDAGAWATAPLSTKVDDWNDISDYITLANNATGTCILGTLIRAADGGAITDPQGSVDHSLRWYSRRSSTNRTTTLIYTLQQGASDIASGTVTYNSGSAWAAGTLDLTGAQADAITDYLDLRVRIACTATGTGNAPQVAALWFEFPLYVSASPTVSPAECTQAQTSDAATVVSVSVLSPGEATQPQTSDAAIVAPAVPTVSISPAESNQAQASDAAGVSVPTVGVLEDFESTSWALTSVTSGTGSTAARSNEQADSGTYSGKFFTTNTGAAAYVYDAAWSDDFDSIGNDDHYVWQRARVYVPSTTTNALSVAEYFDLGGFWQSDGGAGFYLRVMAGGSIYVYGRGYTEANWATQNLYGTIPLDQWFTLEMGLRTRNTDGIQRGFILFVDGDCYGWFLRGDASQGDKNYNRDGMGIVATNSADDLTVYLDNWRSYTTGTTPTGTDNRPTANLYTQDYRNQSGKNWEVHWDTWTHNLTMDSTYGLYAPADGSRLQSGINHAKMPDMSSGWAEICVDWPGGTAPAWPPVGYVYGNGDVGFGPMIAFHKDVPNETNLEVQSVYRGGTVCLRYQAWTGSTYEYATWGLPNDTGAGHTVLGRGDILRYRWTADGNNLHFVLDFYDASAGTWSLAVIDDTRDLSDIGGGHTNFMDASHRAVTNTIDSNDYSILYQTVGQPYTLPVYVTAGESTQAQASDAATVYLQKPSWVTSPDESTQNQVSDAATDKVITLLIAGESTQVQTSDAATVAAFQANYSVTPGEATQSQTSDSASVTAFQAVYTVSAGEATQSQNSDAATVTAFQAVYSLTAGKAVQTQTSDAPTLSAGVMVTVGESTQTQTSDGAAALAVYVLSAGEATQTQTSDGASLTVTWLVTAGEATQTQTSDAVSITFSIAGSLEPAEATQTQTSDAATLKAVYILSAVEAAQSQTSDAGIVSGITALTADEAAQTQLSDAVTVTWMPPGTSVTGVKATQAQLSDAATARAIYNLFAGEATQAQISDMGLIILANLILHGKRRLYTTNERTTGQVGVRANLVVNVRETAEVDD